MQVVMNRQNHAVLNTGHFPFTIIRLLPVVFLLVSNGFAGHHIAAGYSRTWIQTSRDDRFTIHSPALHYTGDISVYQSRIYLSLSFLLPKWASQNGRHVDLGDYYARYFGADLFLGVSRDKELKGLQLIPAAGWHLNGIRMRGNSRILDFYSLTSGPGIQLRIHYHGQRMVPEYLLFSCGYDIIDHLYTENKLKRGFCLTTALGYSF